MNRIYPVARIQHRDDPIPNQVLPGYHHVSVAGRYRSTLKYPGTKKEERGGVSARQKRKIRKEMARLSRMVAAEELRAATVARTFIGSGPGFDNAEHYCPQCSEALPESGECQNQICLEHLEEWGEGLHENIIQGIEFTASQARGAVYVGPEESLRGRGALIRTDENGQLLAQLDMKGHPRVPDALQDPRCYGWHEFAPSDFADTKRYRKD